MDRATRRNIMLKKSNNKKQRNSRRITMSNKRNQMFPVPMNNANKMARQSIKHTTPARGSNRMNETEALAYAKLFEPPRKQNGTINTSFDGYSRMNVADKLRAMNLSENSKEKLWEKYHANGHANNNANSNNAVQARVYQANLNRRFQENNQAFERNYAGSHRWNQYKEPLYSDSQIPNWK